MTPTMAGGVHRGGLCRGLGRLFGDVRRGEGQRVFLLGLNLFVLLFAYYLLKTLREPLVLAAKGGSAELKSYATAMQAVLLLGVSTTFGWLATRLPRLRLLSAVILFFAANLLVFAGLFAALPSLRLSLGVAFFIWLGCFNVVVLAQFWSFANDVYTKAEGERLFGVIAIGSAAGGVVGARMAKPLFLWFGTFGVLVFSVGLLLASLALTRWIHHHAARASDGSHERALPEGGGFALLLRDPYLQFVGLLSLCKNLVNSTGEYILDRRLLEIARSLAGTAHDREAYVISFKANYFLYVNELVLVLQIFAASRAVRYIGPRRALLILPLLAMTGYGAMAVMPFLSVILFAKVGENSIDYSVEKTTEQMLFLPTTREAKYKVKAIVDTFAVRLGDVASAVLVWVGVRLAFSTLTFILVNVILVGVWLAIVRGLTRMPLEAPAPSSTTVPTPAAAPAP